jgi:arylsulfatase A-like enzyme
MQYFNYDHEFVSFFCDPTYLLVGKRYSLINGPSSVFRRCLYGKETSEWVLDYTYEFMEAYKDSAKIMKVVFQDAHEATGEVVKYLDDYLIAFLEKIEKNGFLKDTSIVFMSDHGLHMLSLYQVFQLEDFIYEKFLPTFFLVIPKGMYKYEEIKKNLEQNENKLISMFDIHKTFLSFLHKDFFWTGLGKSLYYNVIDDFENDCYKYGMNTVYGTCKCRNYY